MDQLVRLSYSNKSCILIHNVYLIQLLQIALVTRNLVTQDCGIYIPYPLMQDFAENNWSSLKCHFKVEELTIEQVESGGVHDMWDATELLDEWLSSLAGGYRNSTSAIWARSKLKSPPPAFYTLCPISGGAPVEVFGPLCIVPSSTMPNTSLTAGSNSVSSSSLTTRPSTAILIPFSGQGEEQEPVNLPTDTKFTQFFEAMKDYIVNKMKLVKDSSNEDELYENFNQFSHSLLGYSMDLSKPVQEDEFQTFHYLNRDSSSAEPNKPDPNLSRDMWGIALYLYNKHCSGLPAKEGDFLTMRVSSCDLSILSGFELNHKLIIYVLNIHQINDSTEFMAKFYYDDSKWPEDQKAFALPQPEDQKVFAHPQQLQSQNIIECSLNCKGGCNSLQGCAYLEGKLDANPDRRPELSANAKQKNTDLDNALCPWGGVSSDFHFCANRIFIVVNRMVKDTKLPTFWVATDTPQVNMSYLVTPL